MSNISATESGKRPDYRKTAAEILAACREFYAKPENEAEFQRWKARKRKESEE